MAFCPWPSTNKGKRPGWSRYPTSQQLPAQLSEHKRCRVAGRVGKQGSPPIRAADVQCAGARARNRRRFHGQGGAGGVAAAPVVLGHHRRRSGPSCAASRSGVRSAAIHPIARHRKAARRSPVSLRFYFRPPLRPRPPPSNQRRNRQQPRGRRGGIVPCAGRRAGAP